MANPIVGVSFYIRSRLGNLVLDVQGGNTNPGTPVIVYPQNSPASRNQLWTVTRDGYIQSQLGNLFLDVRGSNTNPGTPVIIYSRNSPASNNQLWTLESVIYTG